MNDTNRIGLTKKDYQGSPSTLCTGCGHDQITQHIITALYQLNIDPYQVVKTSGIGCSSKTPAYFLSRSFGINFIHGRMAPLATGSVIAAPYLTHIGISGDGDTGSIGLGGFIHLIRRNVPLVYIIANNGVYGLTKGQFSATSDLGAKLKTGDVNLFENIDLCTLALDVGCTFVARSFSGDMKQMVTILKAALKHRGTAVIDVISPCVTFNNHDGSTKSFSYVKEHDDHLHELGFIPSTEAIQVDYSEGMTQEIVFNDGSRLILEKVQNYNHNVEDRLGAMQLIHESYKQGRILTGIFYINETKLNLIETLNLNARNRFSNYKEDDLRGTEQKFHEVMNDFI